MNLYRTPFLFQQQLSKLSPEKRLLAKYKTASIMRYIHLWTCYSRCIQALKRFYLWHAKQGFTSKKAQVQKSMSKTTLSDLFSLLEGAQASPNLFTDVTVTNFTCDSRKVYPGVLYFDFAPAVHRLEFALEAEKNGACAAISEFERPAGLTTLTWIQVDCVRTASATLSKAYRGAWDEKLFLIGITGTNGKTTTAQLAHYLLSSKDTPVGALGTLHYNLGKETIPAVKTTPEAYDSLAFFEKMHKNGCQTALMEVSSHGISLQRVGGFAFDVGVFLNLTPEHLDFHHTLEAYYQAKKSFFSNREASDYPPPSGRSKSAEFCKDQLSPIYMGPCPRIAIINLDDPYGARLVQELRTERPQTRVFTISTKSVHADFYAKDLQNSINSICGTLHGPFGKHPFTLPVCGPYNAYNLLAALAITYVHSLEKGNAVNWESVFQNLSQFPGVPGRMQPVCPQAPFFIRVDYAHTPDALENVLQSLKSVCPKRLHVVFGCGGQRDPSKRPLMLAAVQKYADKVYATADNPREEPLENIFADMQSGLLVEEKTLFIPERRRAIQEALKEAQPGDCVLIAGKGHEPYQILGKEIIAFEDAKVAQEIYENHVRNRPEIWKEASILPENIRICTDTRALRSGDCFVALIGPNHNGHDYLQEAYEKGAALAIVSQPERKIPLKQIIVPDTKQALWTLAKEHRQRFAGTLFAITGSCGKTSSKEALTQLLGSAYTLSTYANENNTYGVPKTLMQLDNTKHRFAVIEAGIDRPGEMDILSSITQPDVALITHIGPSHLQDLGSPEGVAKEKVLLAQNAKIALFPKQALQFSSFSELSTPHYILCENESRGDLPPPNPNRKGYFYFSKKQCPHKHTWELTVWSNHLTKTAFTLPPMTAGMVHNIALTLCACSLQNIWAPARFQNTLSNWTPFKNRGQIKQFENVHYYIDCYNANPTSMLDSYQHFFQCFSKEAHHLYIIGCMEELGKEAEKLHRSVAANWIPQKGANIWIIGDWAENFSQGLLEAGLKENQIHCTQKHEDLTHAIKQMQNGAIFIKGSKKHKLWECLPSTLETVESRLCSFI